MNGNGLPAGWAWVEVQALAAPEPGSLTDGPFGSNLKTEHYTESGPRVIRLQNIGDGAFVDEKAHIGNDHFERLRRHEARTDDVVVAMLGESLPRACVVPRSVGPAIVKADCVRMRVAADLTCPKYLAAGLNSEVLRKQAAELVHGVGRPRLGLGLFRSLRFPVAPLREQHRIVAAIEDHFSRLDEAVALLERVQRNLKRYRASVLKAAVEGRLVPTEADLARAEGRTYEPASVLLERILEERRRRWKENGGRGAYKEPVAPDTSGLPELPEGWCWASWDQLSARVTVGHVGKMVHEYRQTGIPFLRSQNVRPNTFDSVGLKYVSPEFHATLSKSALSPGDLLIIRSGDVGTACVMPDHISVANCSDLVIVKHPIGVRSRFGAYFMNSLAKAAVRHQQVGIALIHFNTKSAAAMAVPVPPLAEQDRIVDAAERFLSGTDDTESTVAANLARAARLRQSILKWAFEGKLVDQDPTDEPAAVLLERIRAERAARGATKPRRRGRPAPGAPA